MRHPASRASFISIVIFIKKDCEQFIYTFQMIFAVLVITFVFSSIDMYFLVINQGELEKLSKNLLSPPQNL